MTEYGKNIKLRIAGGSHDTAISAEISGLPSGIVIDSDYIMAMMKRRMPGLSSYTTSRREPDVPVFVSGVRDGITDGSVLKVVIYNTDVRSSDYNPSLPRPSHADYAAYMKSCGKADLRGGGHFSGRLTAPMTAVGAVLKKELEKKGIYIGAHILRIADVSDSSFDSTCIKPDDLLNLGRKAFPVSDDSAGEKMIGIINDVRTAGDSVGGEAECAVTGLGPGIGEHFFCGMESRIASIMLSVPAVKGIEFGDTLDYGSRNNDCFEIKDGRIATKTNHAGGITGGMTNGMPVVFRLRVKPAPSIGIPQSTVNLETMKEETLVIKGRHDPCILPRIIPVIEAAAAIAVFDALMDSGEMEK